ncbi:uncharacterized protein LOC130796876 [Amaranthus tricolor]|uniref:uncharacterized protein LOC130796876 n=1 Tax=Amaranthus tricolor TaxID=29722 RepID=UPI0025877B2B|nr:uncharacterized protein LOC130796876 [Amaranthus tricolor]
MSVSEQTSNDLRASKMLMHKLGETFKDFQRHSASITELGDQWQNLQNSFSHTQRSLEIRINELKTKETEIEMMKAKVQNLESEINLKKKELILEGNSLSDRIKMVEMRENQMKEWKEVMELEKTAMYERSKAIGLRENIMKQRYNVLEKKEKEFLVDFERVRAIDVEEKRVAEWEKAVKEKEKELNVNWSELSKRVLVVQNNERRFEEVRKEFELKEKEMDEIYNALELKEKRINEESQSLVNEKKMIKDQWKQIESKEKGIEEKSVGVENLVDEKMMLKDQLKVLELKEKEILENSIRVENKIRDFDEKTKALELKEKRVNEEIENLLNEKRKIKDQWKEIEENSVRIKKKARDVDEKTKGLVLKEKRINDEKKMMKHQWKELESKEKEIEENSVRIKDKTKDVNEKIKALELKEKEMKEYFQEMEMKLDLKEKKFDENWKEKFLMQGKHLDEGCQTSESKEKQSNEPYRLEGSTEMQLVSRSSTPVSHNLPDSHIYRIRSEVVRVSESSSSHITSNIYCLFRNMDAEGIRSYLIDHVSELNILQKKILDALRSSPDSAKIVLDVCRSLHIKFPNNQNAANKSTCILLLELLTELSPSIARDVQDDATFIAVFMKALMKDGKSDTPADIYGFLQFLAAFKLSNDYDKEELFDIFTGLYKSIAPWHEVYRHKNHISLCDTLGFLNRIPDHVKYLLQKGAWLAAFKFICVFKLENQFQPVPLLKDRLTRLKQKLNEKLKDRSFRSKIEAKQMELETLTLVTNCITYFELESKFPPDPLFARIKELKMEKEKRQPSWKRSASSEPCAFETSLRHQEKRPRVRNTNQIADSDREQFPQSAGHASHSIPNAHNVDPRSGSASLVSTGETPCSHGSHQACDAQNLGK